MLCSKCQVQQDSPLLASVIPWNWPAHPWSRLHVDYLGPFLGHMCMAIDYRCTFQMDGGVPATIQCLAM